MKNIVLASLLGFGLISSAWATETVNIHERVNNAQAPAHQMQSAAAPVGIQGTAPRMAGMDQHEQAIIAHETMTNGSADAHQKMVESHQRMMGSQTVSPTGPSGNDSNLLIVFYVQIMPDDFVMQLHRF
ncbi:silver-binding protein SilE [Escherichia coli]|nr:silver-binding protein SilE [Escherichia coli]CTZ87111.1 silver-binding protein SilE [Escherichia coli]CTZ88691.1 silver-binding protein SilE [Escherichia coli]